MIHDYAEIWDYPPCNQPYLKKNDVVKSACTYQCSLRTKNDVI